jgi:hypothetical protein
MKLFLSELKTIRLVCSNEGCGGVIEMPCDQFREQDFKCPVCIRQFNAAMGSGMGDPLFNLIKSMHHLACQANKFQVQFELND